MIIPITTPEELSIHLAKYRYALQHDASSEARFVMVSDFDEIYLLVSDDGYAWVGVQQERWIFFVRDLRWVPLEIALDYALNAKHMALYYSDNGVERLHWMAEQLMALKAVDDLVEL